MHFQVCRSDPFKAIALKMIHLVFSRFSINNMNMILIKVQKQRADRTAEQDEISVLVIIVST